MLHTLPLPLLPAILIVDDEPFIALDLALAVEDAGCLVVGPAGSVREALSLLASSRVTAAILDVNLSDGDVTPVVDILVARGIPLIFQTGVGLPPSLKARYPDLLVYAKPVMSERLVDMLIGLIPQA
ncbi:response regulator [Bosea sp. LjRoot9]|uniref:response regulator n=1 Tax=Bosea sp. LjRoot9 TaxID=3342341 RepID=UPI003ECDCC72